MLAALRRHCLCGKNPHLKSRYPLPEQPGYQPTPQTSGGYAGCGRTEGVSSPISLPVARTRDPTPAPDLFSTSLTSCSVLSWECPPQKTAQSDVKLSFEVCEATVSGPKTSPHPQNGGDLSICLADPRSPRAHSADKAGLQVRDLPASASIKGVYHHTQLRHV